MRRRAAAAHRPRLAWSMYRRAFLGALLLVLGTGGAVAAAGLHELGDDTRGILEQPPIPGTEARDTFDDVTPGGPQTIMLLGSDRRFADGAQPGNSDTMVLLRLDPDRRVTSIMSIPRDLRVDVPDVGRGKANTAYANGGPALAVRTVRRLFADAGAPVPINHVVDVNFGGFARAVNRLGCIYTDVDRRYFNDNDPPVDSPTDYAVIDVKAGYQRLCGKAALEYVRFRHLDNDLVRGARQQDFLRQAKDQVAVSRLVGDRKALLDIVADHTRTDIHEKKPLIRLLKLAVVTAGNPLQEVRFDVEDATDGSNDLLATQAAIRRAGRTFMRASPPPSASPKRPRRARTRTAPRRAATAVPTGLREDRTAAEDLAARLEVRTPFPVYFPAWADTGLRSYDADASRAYAIRSPDGELHRAYRIVARTAGTGAYYGVQGTDWKDPPILEGAQKRSDRGGRTFEVIGDGTRYRLVAWRTPRAVYWVSNTLQLSLDNTQMLGIARSLSRVGR